MTTNLCPDVSIPRSDESLPRRAWQAFRRAARAAWLQQAERRVLDHRLDAAAHLSLRTLAGLGTPDAAAAWRELQRQRSPGGGTGVGERPWRGD